MEKVVKDFLSYIEEETQIKIYLSTVVEEFKWVTTYADDIDSTIRMPAVFYMMGISLAGNHLIMKLRYCPCDLCQKVEYVELINMPSEFEEGITDSIIKQLNTAVPDIPVYAAVVIGPQSDVA